MKILLFRGRGISSALIRWQTWSKYSHVAVYLDDGSIIESEPGIGVRHLSLPKGCEAEFCAERGGCLVLTPVIDAGQEAQIIRFLKLQVGKPYDWRGVFRFVLPFIKHNPLDSMIHQNRWFCSDVLAAAFDFAGCPLLYRIPFYKVSPEKITYSLRLQEDYNPDWDSDWD
jgi:uncharacterized protein YycO